MDTPLLATKLFVPQPRPGLVVRPRLVESLNHALNSGLALVSAPAGFGKTTAVVQWALQRKDISVAWVSLDDGDNDPVRFWDYFIAALRRFKPKAGDAASSVLHSGQSYTIEAVLTSLINDVSDISQDFVVVLDDYHLIKADAVHAAMAFWLDHMPPKMHLVISTRADPPLPLPHLRGRGTLVEVVADDLRFTDEEAARLLKEMLGVPLPGEQTASLNAHTEGWAVGLKMAALSMRGEKDIQAFITGFTGSQRYVMDYLMDEVLKRQSENVRDFLLKTSVLDRLSAPLCDFVTGRSGSQATLAGLEQANLFVVALDDSRQWYRYHHLFGELLRHQLEVTSGAARVAALHRQASRWYEGSGYVDDAVRHALAAKDREAATRLIDNVAQNHIRHGETVTLLNWLRAVPEEVLRVQRRLYRLLAYALIRAAREYDAAEEVLSYLEKTAQNDMNLQGEIAVLRALVAQETGDYQRAMDLCRTALSLLNTDNVEARATASQYLGFILFEKGMLHEAEPALTEAYHGAMQSRNYNVAAPALNFLGVIARQRGRLHRAAELYRQAIALDERSPASISSRLALSGGPLYEWNNLEEAAHHQQQVIELSKLSGTEENSQAHIFLAWTKRAQGDTAGAAIAAEKAGRIVQIPGAPRYGLARIAAFSVLLAIWQGDPAATERWRQRVLEYADALPSFLCYVVPRVVIASGDKAAALEQLRALYDKASGAGHQYTATRIRVYQALAAPTPDEGMAFLSEALEMGQPEGFIRTFVDEGRLVKPLLRKALAQGITPEYTAKLLNIIEAEDRMRQARSGADSSPVPSGILSDRELEILRLVAAGLSNGQIADRLVISFNTAKTHIHNISKKLNAKTRTQAIARARELNLI